MPWNGFFHDFRVALIASDPKVTGPGLNIAGFKPIDRKFRIKDTCQSVQEHPESTLLSDRQVSHSSESRIQYLRQIEGFTRISATLKFLSIFE
jgi:hypothetical protein